MVTASKKHASVTNLQGFTAAAAVLVVTQMGILMLQLSLLSVKPSFEVGWYG